jgi:TRAP-type mannitol/chloroaromatic compound transport system permease small subunit
MPGIPAEGCNPAAYLRWTGSDFPYRLGLPRPAGQYARPTAEKAPIQRAEHMRGIPMQPLLALARLIDRISAAIGRGVMWLIFASILISAANAVVRKIAPQLASNAWLELQWYLFGALFLLASGYTLLKNGHVRVDILAQKLPRRTQIAIEIFGVLFFLMPVCWLIMWLAWPMFWESWVSNEVSSNSGGLIRWPVKLLIPIGFMLLIAAGFSHLIKCIGFLTGHCPDPLQPESAKSDEQKLAEELARRLDADRTGAPEQRQ